MVDLDEGFQLVDGKAMMRDVGRWVASRRERSGCLGNRFRVAI